MLWVAFWPLLDTFWLFWGSSKSYFLKALVQDQLQEVFWMDLGSLWEGFGPVLGGLRDLICATFRNHVVIIFGDILS